MGAQISVETMERTRVARFKRLTPTTRGFVDTAIPGYERLIYNVIGRGVTEDSGLKPAISDSSDFNLTLVKKAPASGSVSTIIRRSKSSCRSPAGGACTGATMARTS